MIRAYQNISLKDRFKKFFQSKSNLSRLILANLAIYLLILISSIFNELYFFLYNIELGEIRHNPFVEALMLPASYANIASKPWTFLTYQFSHSGFLHILFNMIMLYFSGRIFLEFLREKQLFWIYIIGGIFGGVFYVLAFNTFPVFQDILPQARAIGASASVFAILFTVATFVPNYQIRLAFIGNVKIKWIALVFIVIDILSINKGNSGGHIAHLGGAFWGFLAGSFFILNRDFKITDKFKNLKRKPKKRKFKAKKQRVKPVSEMSDQEYNARRAERQKEIDAILDKISKFGYEKLTKEEKDLLFRSSKNQN